MPTKELTYEDKLAMVTDYYSKFPTNYQRDLFSQIPSDMTIIKQVDFLFDKMQTHQRQREEQTN